MTGSTVPRRQLGRHLRELRSAVGLTIGDAAELMQWSFAMLQRVEKGQVDKVRDIDVRELCRIYEAEGEQVEGLIGLARQANSPEWWHAYGDLIPEKFDVYMGLENSAKHLSIYQSELVPGLLQAPQYARAQIRNGWPEESVAEVDRRLQLRIKRQSLVTRSFDPVLVDVVVHESVVRQVIGSRSVMAAQCKALADIGTRDNVTVRVLPFEAGYPTVHQIGPFTVLEFGLDSRQRSLEPTVIYLEAFTGAMYLDKPSTVAKYEKAFETLRAATLDVQASRRKLRELAKEYAQ